MRSRPPTGLPRDHPPTVALFLPLLLAALLSVPSAAKATASAVYVDGAPELSAGSRMRVTWDPLPWGTEEFELLLRCESPVAVTLRLTESKAPDHPSWDWVVPGIRCDRARLVLRLGRGRDERLWAESDAFRIECAPSTRTPRLAYLRGEYWVSPEAAPQSWRNLRRGLAGGAEGRQDPCEGSAPETGGDSPTSKLRSWPAGKSWVLPTSAAGRGSLRACLVSVQIRI